MLFSLSFGGSAPALSHLRIDHSCSLENVTCSCVLLPEVATPAAKVENSSKQVAAAKLKISDAHLLALVKLVHGSARSKNDLVQELIEGQPDIPKSRAEKIIATFAQKRVEKGASRWILLEETLKRSAFIAEIAKDAWKVNTSQKVPSKVKAGGAGGGVATAAVAAEAPVPMAVEGV